MNTQQESQAQKTQSMRSPEELRKIMDEFAGGMRIWDLAKKYNLSRERIRQILNTNPEEYQAIRKKMPELRTWVKENAATQRYPAFIELTKKLGRIPTLVEVKRYDMKFLSVYYKLRARAEKDGFVFKTYYEITWKDRSIRKEEMLNHLKDLALKYNRTPNVQEINAAGKYFGSTYAYYFGTLAAAQKLAGLKPNKRGAQPGNSYGKKGRSHSLS